MKLRKSMLFIASVALIGLIPQPGYAKDLADYANPLVGTDSEHAFSNGNTYPTCSLPFGLTAWTAQTGADSGWVYQYKTETMNGFKATHQPSPWIGDYGHFSIFPVTGELPPENGKLESAYTHANEISRPYVYSVLLGTKSKKPADHTPESGEIMVEMTPTVRSSAFRITYPKKDDAFLIFNVFNKGKITISDDKQKVYGKATANRGGTGGKHFGCYFVAEFSKPIKKFGTLKGTEVNKKKKQVGRGEVFFVEFKNKEKGPVRVNIGTSFISHEQAELNLRREIGDKDFDTLKAEAKKVWNDLLSIAQVEGMTEDQKMTFYTNLYRCYLFPRIFYEYDKDNKMIHYSPYNGEIVAGEMYADNGFWDTFRAVYPFFTIFDPELDASMIRGWINASKEGGWFPKWCAPGYRDCMIGTHVESLIADALAKGITDFDLETAYKACYRDGTDTSGGYEFGRRGLQHYIDHGYVACDKVGEATARTLEYAYDDWCIAKVAEYMDKEEDAKLFFERSQNYKNVFDPSVGFMRGRKEGGEWKPDFDPTEWGNPFTEGSSWHYSWSVLHDMEGLVQLMGGDAGFSGKLDQMFAAEPTFKVGHYGREIHEMTEMVACNMGQYAHGNQPVHHVLYLYNYAGQPWKGAPVIRQAVDTLYGPGPDGYCGDEDNGQMSAWYIFSVLGFYPVCPGYPYYVIGSPRYPKATLNLLNGKTFTVVAKNNSDTNIYIQSVKLNGKPLSRSYINHDEIMSGGTLEFVMGDTPNKDWGKAFADRPYSMTKR